MASLLIYWSILLINLKISHGLMCYECTSNDPLSQCVVNNGRIAKCPYKYCILSRTESSDGSAAFSFIRGCTNEPQPPNVTRSIENHELKHYYRYCSEDWCNGGDGTSEKNSQQIIFVKGMDSSAAKYSSVNIFLLVIPSIYRMLL